MNEFLEQFITLSVYALNTLIFMRVILSWLSTGEDSWIQRFLFESTEPIIRPIRNALPRTGVIDFSPIIALFMIEIIASFLLKLI